MEGNYKEVNCIPVVQPIGTMYVCVMDSNFLQKISYADTRRNVNECRDIEIYVGVQRVLNPKREKEIGKYVNLCDASFPNSIVVAMSHKNVEYDDNRRILCIKDEESIASVLDGQHRIAGLKFLKSGTTFECIVTVFVDIDMEDQGIIFSTINTEQQKINKSLAADLAEFYTTRSPQRTCHNIAKALRDNEKSPFYKKISKINAANKNGGETLTQYLFVKELLAHISGSPLEDRDILKKKDFWGNHQRLSYTEKELQKYCLRKLFIEDETDVKIGQIIVNYFCAVRKKWPNSWNEVAVNNILNKSTGYTALMQYFKEVYIKLGKEVPSVDDFYSVFSSIELEDGAFTRDEYATGRIGESKLYKALKGTEREQ